MIHQVSVASDGGFIVAGYKPMNSSYKYKGFVIKYNQAGNIEWEQQEKLDYSYSEYNSVSETSDGGCVITGYYNSAAIIRKYDSKGNLEWENIAGASVGTYGLLAVEIENGKYMMVGEKSNNNNENPSLENGLILDSSSCYFLIGYTVEKVKNIEYEIKEDMFIRQGNPYSYVTSSCATDDGGYIAVGTIYTGTSINGIQINKNGSEGFIAKYNSNDEVEWVKILETTRTDNGSYCYNRISSVSKTKDGGFVVVGVLDGSANLTINVGNDIILTKESSSVYYAEIIVKYTKDGEAQWGKIIEKVKTGYSNMKCDLIKETSDGGYLVGGTCEENIELEDGTKLNANDGIIIKLKNDGQREWIKPTRRAQVKSVYETIDKGYIVVDSKGIIKYNNQLDIQWEKTITGLDGNDVTAISATKDGGFIIATNNSYANEGKYIRKYDKDGNEEWAKYNINVGGSSLSTYFTTITETSDGGYIAIAYDYGTGSLDDGIIATGNNDYLVIKYNNELKTEWAQAIKGKSTRNKYLCNIFEVKNGEYIASVNDYNIYSGIIKISESMGGEELQELEIENIRKEYEIKSEINKIDGQTGGTITEEGLIETVKYGDSSTKEIEVIPDEDNEIISITINGKEIPFEVDLEGKYTMPVFENVTEDKYIKVTFAKKTNKIIINNVDSETKENITGSTFQLNEIDERNEPNNEEIIGDLTDNSDTYNFIKNEQGGYESTNQGQKNTTANSYVEVDLRGYTGKYDLTVNAEVSAYDSWDYGYATITKDTTAPAYNSTEGRFIFVGYSVTGAKDYKTTLEGGELYYLHLGYRTVSGSTAGSRKDKFTINSINISLSEEGFYKTTLSTNSNGQVVTQIPHGKYSVTQTVAPEGYLINEEPEIIEFIEGGTNEFTIENCKNPKITVHHYLAIKNEENSEETYTYTEEKVLEDEVMEGIPGEEYATIPNVEMTNYTLIKTSEGRYILPENRTGIYTKENQEVKYYYEANEVPVVVHHYIEGTITGVPLKDGTEAEDVIIMGIEGNEYETEAISEEVISDKYELVEKPENATGIHSGYEEVTYYYKEIERNIIVKTYDEGTKEGIEGVIFELEGKEYRTNEKGEIELSLKAGEYELEEKEALEGYLIPENNVTQIIIDRETEEGKVIEIANGKAKGTVTVNHYIQGEDTPIIRRDGTEVEEEVKEGIVGNIYATKEIEDTGYVVVQEPENASGIYQEGNIDVTYYYTSKDAQIITHHYLYNPEKEDEEKYTKKRIVEDEITEVKVGEEYTAQKSVNVPSNYRCIDEEPEGYTGKVIKETVEVTYYYELITPTVEISSESTVTASKVGENGEAILTKEDGEIAYNTKYKVTVKDYIGKALVEMVYNLPAKIDIDKSEIAGGIYDQETNTIKWEQVIENIDTSQEIEITKQIIVVYENQDVTKELDGTVTGKVTTYYPVDYLDKEEGIFIEAETEEALAVEQEYKVNLKVEKQWEDNENVKGHRPESVTINISGADTETKILNESNNWKYEKTGLPKYNLETGKKIEYIVTERETNEKDLEYYEGAKIAKTETQNEEVTNYIYVVTNTYKLMQTELNTVVTKETLTSEITSREDRVGYTIKVSSEIKDYIGEGKIIIVDTLPYPIDESKSNLSRGTYNEETNTIRWEEDIENINTEKIENGIYKIDITKQITIAYKDVDLESEKMVNQIEAKIQLYETEEKDEGKGSAETTINVAGKVKVKYLEKGTNKNIAKGYEIVDKIGKQYNTQEKEIDGYILVETTKNETGKIGEKEQEVIYYYESAVMEIQVIYEDEDGNELAERVIVEGKEGEEYKTEEKEIENYRLKEIKGEKEGTIEKGKTTIRYVYEKIALGKITVKYIDIETEKELTYKEETEEGKIEKKKYGYEITGIIGEEYETEEKEIPYYKLIKTTQNIKGEITEEDEVIYYYEKLDFNFSIEKTISSVRLNGQQVKIADNKLVKIEIPSKKIEATELIVKYIIKVTNEGELAGTAKVVETIPDGYELVEADPAFAETSNTRTSDLSHLTSQLELEAGESKDLELTLRWVNSEKNLGAKISTAKIEETENQANYKDTNEEDDKAEVTIVVSIKTGIVVSIIIIIMILGSLGICGYIIVTTIKRMGKGPDINKIRFLMKK